MKLYLKDICRFPCSASWLWHQHYESSFLKKELYSLPSIYSNIHGLQSDSLEAYRTTWEISIGMEIWENMWDEALCRVHKSSICSKHGFIWRRFIWQRCLKMCHHPVIAVIIHPLIIFICFANAHICLIIDKKSSALYLQSQEYWFHQTCSQLYVGFHCAYLYRLSLIHNRWRVSYSC